MYGHDVNTFMTFEQTGLTSPEEARKPPNRALGARFPDTSGNLERKHCYCSYGPLGPKCYEPPISIDFIRSHHTSGLKATVLEAALFHHAHSQCKGLCKARSGGEENLGFRA